MSIPTHVEAALIAAARSGDRTAFDRLVAPLRPRLEAVLSAKLGATLRSTTDADDIVQETLLRAFRSFGRFEWRGESSLFRWLCSVGECVALDVARSRKNRSEPRLEGDVPASDTSPSHAIRREERRDRLEEALAQLSPEHRRVIQLVRLEGLKIREAAARMERTPDAVQHLLVRALRKLRDAFGPETESCSLPRRSPDAGGRGHGS